MIQLVPLNNLMHVMKAPVGESAADVIVVLRRMLDLYANIQACKIISSYARIT